MAHEKTYVICENMCMEEGLTKEEILKEQSELENEINVERQRINGIASLPSGSTSGDAELIDIRVGADGKTYSSAGDAVRSQLNNKVTLKEVVNFNIQGYVGHDGITNNTEGFFRSDYISLENVTSIEGKLRSVMGNLALYAFYDKNKNFLKAYTGGSVSQDVSFELSNIPENAKYVIFSKRSGYNGLYAFVVKNPYKYIDKISNYIDFYVGYGHSDEYHYDSLIECLNAAMNKGVKAYIHINSGTYNIYNELGGESFLQSITSSSTAYNIQPWLNNCKIVGEGNVNLEYLPDDNVANNYPLAANLISVLNVRGNVEIENININCKNCRYGIHDETSGNSLYNNTYHNYKNVIVNKGRNATGQTIGGQALGGGFDNGQTYLFENCKFKSIVDNALSYHNRDSKGANFNFNNCSFDSSNVANVRFGNVGVQGQTNCHFSNCHFNGAIYINREADSIPSQNCFKLYVNNCNEVAIQVSAALGTNLLEPEVVNVIR